MFNPGSVRLSFTPGHPAPAPGSAEEQQRFQQLQQQMLRQYEEIFPDKLAPRTVVILPSFSLDQEILARIKGAPYYEERLLCLLMLLRMPLTRIIYITSMPVAESIVDYYLHLLPGITTHHARQRLTLLSCHDASSKPLSQKLLERPRLLERIRQAIGDPPSAHLTCFNITPLEKTLAVKLGIPLFGTDPDKFYEGSKSGGRKNFRASGVSFPDGAEDLSSRDDVIAALAALKRKYPRLRKAVVKLNDGFSGDGNALFRYPGQAEGEDAEPAIRSRFSEHFKPVAADITEALFFEKLSGMGGIVEEFLEGDVKCSPSVQCVISPAGTVEIVSTHDQILSGEDGQIFIGAQFPARPDYSVSLAAEGRRIAETLASKGAMGRFAIDFITVQQADGSWKHYAIEINLRKGGTTHPFLMLQFLTDGRYQADTGTYLTAAGNRRCYFASDNVSSEKYRGLTPEDLVHIAIFHDLLYDSAAQEGVMFHLVGALSEFGKMGMVCIGSSPERARELYDRTLAILDLECSQAGG